MNRFLHLIPVLAMCVGLQLPMEAKTSCSCSKSHKCKKKRKNFYFDALGDTAYSIGTENALKQLIKQTINKEDAAFVVHIGDTQLDARGVPFVDGPLLQITESSNTPPPGVPEPPPYGFVRNRAVLWEIDHPFINTPGDNDWTDTTYEPVLNPDPIGTLEAFRNVFYREGTNVSFPFLVISQADEMPQYATYIENQRWIYQSIVFVTVNTVGEADGTNGSQTVYGTPETTAILNAEYITRNAANIAWLQRAFEIAHQKNAPAVVVFTQSQPGVDFPFGDWNFAGSPDACWGGAPNPGWDDMLSLLYNEATTYPDRKILYIYGNEHFENMTPPFCNADSTAVPNFTTIQVPGFPDTGRMRFYVDFKSKDLFFLSLDSRDLKPMP
jgi:hypothetical protein